MTRGGRPTETGSGLVGARVWERRLGRKEGQSPPPSSCPQRPPLWCSFLQCPGPTSPLTAPVPPQPQASCSPVPQTQPVPSPHFLASADNHYTAPWSRALDPVPSPQAPECEHITSQRGSTPGAQCGVLRHKDQSWVCSGPPVSIFRCKSHDRSLSALGR